MPKCNPRCPVVKEQLRKLVTEAPWLLKENGDRKAALLDGKSGTARLDGKRDGEEKGSIDPDDVGRSKDSKVLDGKRIDATQTPIDAARMDKEEMKGHTGMADDSDKSSVERKKRTSGTQWDDTEEGRDGMGSGKGKMDRANGTDRIGGMETDEMKRRELAMFQDECEPACPRRISRKSRIRKLEEAQCIVDAYLLNKGSRYFDDVCTCSLSCVLRALRRDPFVTSTLASVALFSIGLKLCSELDAWYLPIRFS